MQKKVITRPQTKDRTSANPISIAGRCRVAAYARVSTDEEEQQNSYSAQINHYTNLIRENPDWEFAGMYSDEGISGTSIRHREGFQRMIADALDGKIDRIITKSISRFARNTVDTLSFVRQLKDKGVDVFFEKENIHTLDIKGELMITIMSSLAQEESHSISENVKWGMRKSFSNGKVSMAYSHFLGYRKGPDGSPEIVPEEAAIVERIYDLFLEGKTPSGIARLLTQEAVPTPGNGLKWRAKTVESILTNEKYKGDAILQKTFVADFLTKRKQINRGEYPQYYVMGSHPAIIDPEKFDAVQLEMQRRKASPNHRFTPHCFSGYIYCTKCGSIFGSKTWNSNTKYRRIVWECNNKYSGEKRCNAPIAHEEQVQEAFIKAINKVIGSKAEVIDLCEKALDRRSDIEALEKKIHTLQADIGVTAELMKRQAASDAQTDYSGRYDQLTAELDSANAELAGINSRRPKLMAYLQVLRNQPLVQEFDELLWRGTVDRVLVKETGALRFVFKDGQEVEIR